MAVSLGLAGIFAYRRSWKTARLFGGFALAFAESWRDSRLADKIGDVLAQARRNA